MGAVNCQSCGRFFNLNEVKTTIQKDYEPRCRHHDHVEHMSKEEFAEWKAQYKQATLKPWPFEGK